MALTLFAHIVALVEERAQRIPYKDVTYVDLSTILQQAAENHTAASMPADIANEIDPEEYALDQQIQMAEEMGIREAERRLASNTDTPKYVGWE